jgi:hypothetical protein
MVQTASRESSRFNPLGARSGRSAPETWVINRIVALFQSAWCAERPFGPEGDLRPRSSGSQFQSAWCAERPFGRNPLLYAKRDIIVSIRLVRGAAVRPRIARARGVAE